MIAWRIYDKEKDAYDLGNGTSKLGKIWSDERNVDKRLAKLNRLYPSRFIKERVRVEKDEEDDSLVSYFRGL